MKADLARISGKSLATAPPSLQASERTKPGRDALRAVEREAPGSYLSIWDPKSPTPVPPDQYRPRRTGPTRRRGAGLRSRRAPGGRAYHATPDVPWREAALGPSLCTEIPGRGDPA